MAYMHLLNLKESYKLDLETLRKSYHKLQHPDTTINKITTGNNMTFDQMLNTTLKLEGGVTTDTGGLTNYGGYSRLTTPCC